MTDHRRVTATNVAATRSSWQAADAARRGVVDVIHDGELVAISVSPDWFANAKKDVWQREQR